MPDRQLRQSEKRPQHEGKNHLEGQRWRKPRNGSAIWGSEGPILLLLAIRVDQRVGLCRALGLMLVEDFRVQILLAPATLNR